MNLLLLLVLILELEDDLTFWNMCFNFGVTRKTEESGWGKLTLKQVSWDVSSILKHVSWYVYRRIFQREWGPLHTACRLLALFFLREPISGISKVSDRPRNDTNDRVRETNVCSKTRIAESWSHGCFRKVIDESDTWESLLKASFLDGKRVAGRNSLHDSRVLRCSSSRTLVIIRSTRSYRFPRAPLLSVTRSKRGLLNNWTPPSSATRRA